MTGVGGGAILKTLMPLNFNLNLSFGNIIVGLIFSGIGWVAFSYGKKMGRFNMLILGAALMVSPYFTPNTAATCLVGLALTGALYFARD